MNHDEMKATLEATLSLQSRNAAYKNEDEREPDAHLSAPIDPTELGRLRMFMRDRGIELPPSFVQLLQISNGIDGYMQLVSLSLRSAQGLMEPEDPDDQWSDFKPLHEFVIASGDTSEFIAFDRSLAGPDGEMPVVWVDGAGGRNTFVDLPAFLVSQLNFQQNILSVNQEDRANLSDD